MPIISKKRGHEYGAVFRERLDGDWDFVAMAGFDTFPLLSQADDDQAMAYLRTIAEGIEEEGDRALIGFSTIQMCPACL